MEEALAALQSENARLIALLEAHGIEWRLPLASANVPVIVQTQLSIVEKVALFSRLFQGRRDVYPVR